MLVDCFSTDLSMVIKVTVKQELKNAKTVTAIQKKHTCEYIIMRNASHVNRTHEKEKMTSLSVMLTSITRIRGPS